MHVPTAELEHLSGGYCVALCRTGL